MLSATASFLATLLVAALPSANAASSDTNTPQLIQSLGGPFAAIEGVQAEAQSVLNSILADNALQSANIAVVVVNNATANAWTAGNFGNGTIVLYRGLLALLTNRGQLEAAIAHELAHLQRQDRGGHRRLIIERRADELASIWLGNSCGLKDLFAALSSASDIEREQQHFAERVSYFPDTQCPTTSPLPKAIRALEKAEPGYRRYRRALAALGERGNVSGIAKRLTNEHPTEAKFWILLGDSLSSDAPCEFYQKATTVNPQWFLPWLKLGSCQKSAGLGSSPALERSQSLLPTAEAKQLLTGN